MKTNVNRWVGFKTAQQYRIEILDWTGKHWNVDMASVNFLKIIKRADELERQKFKIRIFKGANINPKRLSST